MLRYESHTSEYVTAMTLWNLLVHITIFFFERHIPLRDISIPKCFSREDYKAILDTSNAGESHPCNLVIIFPFVGDV